MKSLEHETQHPVAVAGSRPAEPSPEQTATKADTKALHIGKPRWLKSKIPSGAGYFDIKRDLRGRKLFTVCEEAKCPNIGSCWNQGTATFMILGDTCTRACRFCNVKTGNPNGWLDPHEPEQTARSIQLMKLDYAVITMVDRDDLEDGGAQHVHEVLRKVKEVNPNTRVEILAGDFHAQESSLRQVLAGNPEVFAHNIETVERLTPRVRDARAGYRQSLHVLKLIKELADYPVFTKSALMLGLGETQEEVIRALQDLREYDVDFITIGQYMRPTKKHLSIKEFVHPSIFDSYRDAAVSLGFKSVVSGPLVRSSFRANFFYEQALLGNVAPSW